MVADNDSRRSFKRHTRRRLPFQLPQFPVGAGRKVPHQQEAPPLAQEDCDFDDRKTDSTSSSNSSDPPMMIIDESDFEDLLWTLPLSECDNWIPSSSSSIVELSDEEIIDRMATSATTRHCSVDQPNTTYHWDSPRSRRAKMFCADSESTKVEQEPFMMVFRDDIPCEDDDQENEQLLCCDSQSAEHTQKTRRRSGFSLRFPTRLTKTSRSSNRKEASDEEDKGLLGDWHQKSSERQLAFDVDSFHVDDFEMEDAGLPLWLLQTEENLETSVPPAPHLAVSTPEHTTPDASFPENAMECKWRTCSAVDETIVSAEDSSMDESVLLPVVLPEEDEAELTPSSNTPPTRSGNPNHARRPRRRKKKATTRRKPEPARRASDFRCDLITVVEESPSDDEEHVSRNASSLPNERRFFIPSAELFNDEWDNRRFEI